MFDCLLFGSEFAELRGTRLELPCLAPNIPSHSICPRIHHLRRLSHLCIRIQSHLAEIMPKPRLEKAPLRICRRLSTAPDVIDTRFEIGCSFSILP